MNNDKYSDLIAKVNNLVLKSYAQMRPFLVAAYMNVEYIRGNQNIILDKNLNIVERKSATGGTYMERKIFNRMSPIYLARLGLLSSNMPVVGFKQNGTAPGRFIDYTEGNRFLNDFITDISFKDKYHKKVTIHSDLHGLVWVKTGINWKAGDLIGEYEVNIKQDGKEDLKAKQTFYEGRPWIEVCSMDEVFVDNFYNGDMDKVTELVHRRMFTLDYIKARWGIDASEDIHKAATSNIGFDLSKQNRAAVYSLNKNTDDKFAYVFEYYHKADAEYPNGIYCVIINDKLVTKILPLPYENDNERRRMIPFDCIRLMELPNYMVGPTIYNQVIPIQDTYNSTKNRVLEYINRLGISQFYAWENSLVNSTTLSNKPGAIFMLRRNAKAPQPVVHDKIGTEFINYLITLENDMLITSGLSPITANGQAKSAMRTDGVVDKITESDQNKLEHAVDNIGSSYLRIFKKILYVEKMRERILTEEVKLAGVEAIDKYINKYKLETVDVEQLSVVNRDFLMKDDRYITNKFNQALALGVYNPQSGLNYVQKVNIMEKMHLGSILDTLDPVEVATNQIVREEHEEMEMGKDPEVESWHIHKQHIYEHNLYRQSPLLRCMRKFESAKYKVILDRLEKHINSHQEQIDAQKDNYGQAINYNPQNKSNGSSSFEGKKPYNDYKSSNFNGEN